MNKESTLAVLLTVFNRKEETLSCLQNLYSQESSIPFDVYLTDDGCTDGTPEAVSEIYPDVHIVKGNGTLYWNRGMYVAWEAASIVRDYDYYLWLNDDTFIYPQMLSLLYEACKTKGNNAIIVGATADTNHTKTTYGGRLSNGTIPNPNGSMVEVTHFNGNIVLIPRFVYHQLGNLDYYFTHSKGDFDYGLRAYKKGIKIYQVGEYLGVCDSHSTLDKWCNPNVSFMQRWKMLHRPNGMPPKETFHLENRHYGLLIAIFHYITIYLRCLFPNLWVKYKRK